MTEEQKFIYLKRLLGGRALGLLQQCDSALDPTLFDSAWRLLEREFLRKDALIHSIAQSIIHHLLVKTLKDTLNYLMFLFSKKFQFQSLGDIFPADDPLHAGNMFFSELACEKLPNFFLVELSRKTDQSFQSI